MCKQCEKITMWLIIGICLVGIVLFLENLHADEFETNNREGDVIPIFSFCSSAKAAEKYALMDIPSLFSEFKDTGEACIIPTREDMAQGVPLGFARLKNWISGPHQYGDMSYSVWEIENIDGLVAWTAIPDNAGPHNIAHPI